MRERYTDIFWSVRGSLGSQSTDESTSFTEHFKNISPHALLYGTQTISAR